MSKGFSVMSVLNDKSRSGVREKSLALVELISVHKLVANENNFYDTSDIDGLKDNIELFGLKQNLVVVRAEDDTYRVIAGHRRMMALRALVDEGKSEFELVPCRVEDGGIDKVEEEMLLIYTNSMTRELSSGEKVKQYERMMELIPDYMKNNNLSGRKREIASKLLNIPSSTLGRIAQVSKNLVPEFREELEQEKISMDTAIELSRFDKDTQKKVHKEHKERGYTKKKDVEQFNEIKDKVKETLGMPESQKSMKEGEGDTVEEVAQVEDETIVEITDPVDVVEEPDLVNDEKTVYLTALDEVIRITDDLINQNDDKLKDAYKCVKNILESEKHKV